MLGVMLAKRLRLRVNNLSWGFGHTLRIRNFSDRGVDYIEYSVQYEEEILTGVMRVFGWRRHASVASLASCCVG